MNNSRIGVFKRRAGPPPDEPAYTRFDNSSSLGRVEVALRIGRDAVHAEELAGLAAAVAEVGQLLQRFAQDDAHLLVAAVGHEDVALLRIAREGDVPDRAFAQAAPRIPMLIDERAYLLA